MNAEDVSLSVGWRRMTRAWSVIVRLWVCGMIIMLVAALPLAGIVFFLDRISASGRVTFGALIATTVGLVIVVGQPLFDRFVNNHSFPCLGCDQPTAHVRIIGSYRNDALEFVCKCGRRDVDSVLRSTGAYFFAQFRK